MKVFSASNYSNLSYSVILAMSDALAYLLALLFAFYTRVLVQKIFHIITLQFTLEYFIFQLWWIFLLYMVIIASFGLYTSRNPLWKESRDLARAVTAVFILVFAIVSFFKLSDEISRLTLLFIWFYSVCFITLFRYFLKNNLFNKRLFSKNAVIIGNISEAYQLAPRFELEHPLGLNIVGVITSEHEDKNKRNNFKILGNINTIKDIISKYDISVGIFLPSTTHNTNISQTIGRLQLQLSQIIIVPGMDGLAFSNAEIHQTLGTKLSYFQINNNLKSFVNRSIKRTIDLTLCLISLPILLIVTALIGFAIKITSKGPVFYSHKRVGRNGRIIGIFKFRSMYLDADRRLEDIISKDPIRKKEWESSFKLKNDPRVTPMGRFLRKTSLDELPQVFNVIVGDMSLIGPRPVVPYELDTYYKDYASYYLMVRPGITGLWQVSGRSDTGYDFRVARDTWYVLNWSPWLDIIILLKTPIAVLKQDGAY